MIQFLTDLLLALKASVEEQVALDFEVRNLNRDFPARSRIRASIDRGGVARRNEALKGVVIDLVAGKDGWHGIFRQSEDMTKTLKKSWKSHEKIMKIRVFR